MRITSVSVLYVTVIAFFWWLFLSSIIAQGGYDEPGHIGPRHELFNPHPFYDAVGIDIQAEEEDWYADKGEIPYIYPWKNRIGQTAQQMIAILSVLEAAGMTPIDIELFLLELEEVREQGGK